MAEGGDLGAPALAVVLKMSNILLLRDWRVFTAIFGKSLPYLPSRRTFASVRSGERGSPSLFLRNPTVLLFCVGWTFSYRMVGGENARCPSPEISARESKALAVLKLGSSIVQVFHPEISRVKTVICKLRSLMRVNFNVVPQRLSTLMA